MLATGGSVIATIDLLKKAGCSSIKVLVLVAAPETNYKGAKARQKLVLEQMVDQGMITQAEADYAYQQDLELVDE